ncbi:MAG: glucosamine-6-phosphate deaminase [Cyclobacteriaceae bacterium]
MNTLSVANLAIEVFDTRQALGEAAGKAIESKMLELLGQQDEIRMIFAAAPSQNEVLKYLRGSARIPWHRVTAFHMDEYIGLPAKAPQRFANFLKDKLFDLVPFKAVHLMDGDQDSETECQRYTALLTEKPIDIVCLGIGENGHIAFNDPPVADFNDPEIMKVVTLDQACRQQQVNDGCFATIDLVPKEALTLTVPTLMQGNFLYCVVPGDTKRAAIAKTLADPVSTDCPATILKEHPNCHLYLDQASYGKSE